MGEHLGAIGKLFGAVGTGHTGLTVHYLDVVDEGVLLKGFSTKLAHTATVLVPNVNSELGLAAFQDLT